MTDREKVIRDLDEQIAWIRDNDFHKFPGWGHAVLAMSDALELLKEQEPRVMTLDEVKSMADGGTAYWIEFDGKCYPAMVVDDKPEVTVSFAVVLKNGYSPIGNFKVKEYGNWWRCWNIRPTEEHREAVKW